jgi:hypothetical protein
MKFHRRATASVLFVLAAIVPASALDKVTFG